MRIIYETDFGERVEVSVPNTLRLTKHFVLKEVANHKAKEKVKYISTPRTRKFMALLEAFREWYDASIDPTSGYRTRSYNQQVGGSYNSLHLDGLALDFKALNVPEKRRLEVREKWREITKSAGEIGGINYYTHGYHICIGEEKFGNKGFVTRDYRQKRGDW